jgi:hypothetical protein
MPELIEHARVRSLLPWHFDYSALQMSGVIPPNDC